jgi:uncharacterized protein YndB with AHSA1/START domain
MSEPWTHTFTCPLTGSPDRVFSALTDPYQLRRWFAEHVEIEPRQGGHFRFWGRHTYGVPDRERASQRLTRLETGRALAFTWPMDGVDSEVTLELSPDVKNGVTDGARTSLTLRHSFAGRPAVPYSAELVDDLWRFTLGNLEAHLLGGDGIVRPDFDDPTQEIRLSIVIDAPRPSVFRALVEPDALNKWIASAAEVDPRTGGRYTYAWKYAHGGREVESGPTKILDFVANERIVTDWTDWRGDDTRAPTRVAWLLEDAGSGTKVTLIHSGFSRVVDQSDYPFGWRSFLDRLKRLVETGTAA